MNRLITHDLPAVSPDQLPPPQRTAGRVRVLFVHSNQLGFANQTRQLKAYAGVRDDVDAVHLDLVRPLWMKVLGKTLPVPGGWDLSGYRNLALTRARLTRVLRPVLDHFDVIHITTQGVAASVLDLKGAAGPRWSVYCDSTAAAEVRAFGASAVAAGPMVRAERRMFEAADLIVTMSHWAERSVREDYGVPGERTFVAPGCLPLPGGPERTGDGPLRIAFVGNDWVRKGGPELLAVHQEHFADSVHLDVVSARVRADPGARNVTFHGAVPHETVVGQILPGADLFVLPTRFDMSPWVILEAAGAGLPVISSDLAAIPEMVVHERTGLLVRPGDRAALGAAIGRLVGDADLRRRMGAAARGHVHEHYDPDRVYNQLLDRLVSLAR